MATTDRSDLSRLRERAPLVLNITNHVVMNSTANALLAIGASPVMAHAIEEIEDMVDLAQALVLNIGTLNAEWIESMFKAGRRARQRRVPIVLDPVGAGATRYRTATARQLLQELKPEVVRGNASEIAALLGDHGTTKGVDNMLALEQGAAAARALARSTGCTVSISGPVDVIVTGADEVRVHNGHPWMAQVTGMGCTSTAITGGFLAVCARPHEAAVRSALVMGVAGDLAAARARGPGSFQAEFLDRLSELRDDDLLTLGKLGAVQG